MSERRKIPIHASLNRPTLILGCDRELVLLTGGSCFILALETASVGSFARPITFLGPACAVILWILSVYVLRQMAKADPLLRHVYIRHCRYQAYYPAKSAVDSQAVPVPSRWPK